MWVTASLPLRFQPKHTQINMAIRISEVDKIAQLAKLAVDDTNRMQLHEDLSRILGLFDELAAINTDHLSPMGHPLDRVQRLREDTVTESDERDLLQAGAPTTDDGHYLVPKVIE